VEWLSLSSTRFHWIRSPPLSSLSQVCSLTVIASHNASITPQLLCLDFLQLSHSLSTVPSTFSRCLRLSKDLLTLSPPFLRLSHAVSAFPPTFSRCFCLSSDFLTLSPLPPTFSLPVSPTLYQVFHFVLLSLSTSDFVLPKRIYRLTSAHVTMGSVSFKKKKEKRLPRHPCKK